MWGKFLHSTWLGKFQPTPCSKPPASPRGGGNYKTLTGDKWSLCSVHRETAVGKKGCSCKSEPCFWNSPQKEKKKPTYSFLLFQLTAHVRALFVLPVRLSGEGTSPKYIALFKVARSQSSNLIFHHPSWSTCLCVARCQLSAVKQSDCLVVMKSWFYYRSPSIIKHLDPFLLWNYHSSDFRVHRFL